MQFPSLSYLLESFAVVLGRRITPVAVAAVLALSGPLCGEARAAADSGQGVGVPPAPTQGTLPAIHDTPKYHKPSLDASGKKASGRKAAGSKKAPAAKAGTGKGAFPPKTPAQKNAPAQKVRAQKVRAGAKVPASSSAKPAVPAKAAVPASAKKTPAAAAAGPAATTAGTQKKAEKITFPASRVTPLQPKRDMHSSVAETWMPLLLRLHNDGIEMGYLRSMFGRMGDSYSHEPMGSKVNELFTLKFVPRPPRKTPVKKPDGPPVYKSMVTPESVAKCKAYLDAHAAAFTRMEEQYGVPKEVVVGLLMVETRLGTFLGHNSSFWSLACMAAADKPDRVEPALRALPLPMTADKEEWLQKVLRERSAWAYKELLALIRHGMKNNLDPLAMPGSVYGAIGICQFMPSNLPKFAVDGNKDGKIDLFDPEDAIPSVGNYLKEHGWAGKDRDIHHKTLKRYNKSTVYANTILAIADAVAVPPGSVTADAGKPVSAGTKTAAKNAGKGDGKAASPATVSSGAKKGAAKAAPQGDTGKSKKKAPAKKKAAAKKKTATEKAPQRAPAPSAGTPPVSG